MPVHNVLNLIASLLITILGNSLPASAQSDEKDPQGCEPALSAAVPAADPLIVEQVADLPSDGASGMAWIRADNSLWLVTVDKNYGKVRLFEPLKSAVEVFNWDNLKVSQDQPPRWTSSTEDPFKLIIGEQAMGFDFAQPSRVRIMPVGGFKGDETLDKVRASFLFAGLDGEEMVAWSEEDGSANQFSVKLARLESLTSPAFSLPLAPGEIVKTYQSLPGSGIHGFLAVLTSQRILLFKYSSH